MQPFISQLKPRRTEPIVQLMARMRLDGCKAEGMLARVLNGPNPDDALRRLAQTPSLLTTYELPFLIYRLLQLPHLADEVKSVVDCLLVLAYRLASAEECSLERWAYLLMLLKMNPIPAEVVSFLEECVLPETDSV